MKLLFILGTRPEAIKMAPLILQAKADPFFCVRICVTGQHQEMLYQVLDFFGISPDHDLKVMRKDQTLFDVTADILKGLETVLHREKPDLVFVQGDTTTAFVGALAAFYLQIPVAHLEAGLRSFQRYSPFPEEMNRILAGHLAEHHFAPTAKALENLGREGIVRNVHNVGNTVIDGLILALENIKKQDSFFQQHFSWLDKDRKLILVTGHRRESFGEPFENICRALRDISDQHDVEIVYPVHLNPNVRKPVFDMLRDRENIHLIEPLSYPYLVWLMERSYLILTDSGGIQEEAPSLGKPVLVMREVTERTEGIEAGTCKLVGTDRSRIVAEADILLRDASAYEAMAKTVNPYGDGHSSERIVSIIKGFPS